MKAYFFLVAVLVGIGAAGQSSHKPNLLLMHSNRAIAFNKVNSSIVRNATLELIEVSGKRIHRIVSIPVASKNLENTVLAFDELQYDLSDLLWKQTLIAAVYEDDSVRFAANEAITQLNNYIGTIFLNEPLYRAIISYAQLPASKRLLAHQQKFLQETILSFEKNGMKLPADRRKEVTVINEKINALNVQYNKNLAEMNDSVLISTSKLTGIPEHTRQRWTIVDNSYVVSINRPNFDVTMEYAADDEIRKAVYEKYYSRCYPSNLSIFDSLLFYRHQLARQLGFRSFAAYNLVDKMAATPSVVWNFEYDLINKLTPGANKDIAALKQMKRELKAPSADSVFEWDLAFYRKALLREKYGFDSEEGKKYFELNGTIKRMFKLFEMIFDIQVRETSNKSTWHSQVTTYEMLQDGKKLGSFYFDLYPRKNKYTQFQCLPVSQYRKVNDKQEILPVAALICNFPEGTDSLPALLDMEMCTTLFHEFGHLVHVMVNRSDIASQFLSTVKWDFLETPSQFVENLLWEYDAIKIVGRHYITGEVLPETLFKKMKATETVGKSINTLIYLSRAILDLTIHDKYDSIQNIALSEVEHQTFSLTKLPSNRNKHFICNFLHFTIMPASYYGYDWSVVYAKDLFAGFKKDGVLSVAQGRRYRDIILKKTGSVQETDLVTEFLGRAPNAEAFSRWLEGNF